jgi:hypothetical protein
MWSCPRFVSPGDLPDFALHGRLKAPAMRTYEGAQKTMSYLLACILRLYPDFTVRDAVGISNSATQVSSKLLHVIGTTRTPPSSTVDGLTIAMHKVPKGVLLVAVLRQDRHRVRFLVK